MLNSEGRLEIFDNFVVDRNLPKFRSVELDSLAGSSIVVTAAGTSGFVIVGSNMLVEEPPKLLFPGFQPTWMQSILIRLLLWVSPKPLVYGHLAKPLPPAPELSVQEFFKSVKNTQEELVVVDERVKGYEAAVARATASGQVAMVEQLKAGLQATRAETQLHAVGVTRALLEETLVEFVKKSPKGLRLDWIKNFTRHIPDDVIAAKTSCDDHGVFDNYAILHYDPEAKSWAETHQEREARKDPILFGLLRGSRKLYFVGEWIDEFCDLSLDQIADVLARDSVTEELDVTEFVMVSPDA